MLQQRWCCENPWRGHHSEFSAKLGYNLHKAVPKVIRSRRAPVRNHESSLPRASFKKRYGTASWHTGKFAVAWKPATHSHKKNGGSIRSTRAPSLSSRAELPKLFPGSSTRQTPLNRDSAGFPLPALPALVALAELKEGTRSNLPARPWCHLPRPATLAAGTRCARGQ